MPPLFPVSVIMQISTSVQQTAEVVTLKPAALIWKAVSRVHVYLGTPEMDLPAQVSHLKPERISHGMCS